MAANVSAVISWKFTCSTAPIYFAAVRAKPKLTEAAAYVARPQC